MSTSPNARPGDEVVLLRLDPEHGEIRLTTAQLALARARRLIRKHVRTDADLTRSLIDDRRAEAAREQRGRSLPLVLACRT